VCGLGEARPPEPRKAQNELPDAFWEPFGHQSPEQLTEMSFALYKS